MTQWLRAVLGAHPEITFFLVLGIGHLLGKLAWGNFKLGAVTGTLLAGVIVGQLGLALPDEVKQCFFLLFLFAIGFRTGPQFFLSLKKDGLQHAALAAIVATGGLLVAYAVARYFRYDAGTAAGLLAGSLTESAAIGTAMDTISRLDLAEATRSAMANNIPVAFAVTYVIGMTGAAWILSLLAPWLMRVNLADQCRQLEQGMQGAQALVATARRDIEVRAYAIDPASPWGARSVADIEAVVSDARIFVERVRRHGRLIDSDATTRFVVGDVIAVSGPRAALVGVLEAPGSGLREVDDKDLLDVSVDVVDVVVTNSALAGRTLVDLGREEAARGVFLKRLVRAGMPLDVVPDTKVHQGDVLTIFGSVAGTSRAVQKIGVADRPTDATDMLVVAAAVVAGALVGLPVLSIAGVAIGLSLPVGVLLGGLICGWLRATHPSWIGHIPGAALSVFESLGLAGFVAVVGLNAGPAFIAGLKTSGWSLLIGGVLTIATPLLLGVVTGRWLFKMHPGVLLGVCAGACTATPALAAVQETAKSAVPAMGYGIAYAVGNVFLALWGTVIVAMIG
jgi:putative transport protein